MTVHKLPPFRTVRRPPPDRRYPADAYERRAAFDAERMAHYVEWMRYAPRIGIGKHVTD